MVRLTIVVALAGCVTWEPVVCDDGRACPTGTVCKTLTAPEARICASVDQIDQCEGLDRLAVCDDGKRCYDGVCLAAGCGNGRLDPDEICDDGNTRDADGCSATCISDESCRNLTLDLAIGEACDDGNALAHDGCASLCTTEKPRWEIVVPHPPARSFATFAYDAHRDRFVLFGGADAGPFANALGDTWEWDGHHWSHPTPTIAPLPRTASAMAYDAVRRRVVLFAGSIGEPLDDMWEWDGSAWTLLHPTTSPGARSGHQMVYDAARRRIVLYGGYDGHRTLDDTWQWDGTTWTRLAEGDLGPLNLSNQAMAYDPKRGVVVRFGGRVQRSVSNQVSELVGNAWIDVTPPETDLSPTQRGRAAMTWDPVTSRVLLSGGEPVLGDAYSDECWAWDGLHWTLLPAGPVAANHVLATSAATGLVIAVDTNGATWRWDGDSWTIVDDTTASAPAITNGAAAVDLAGHRMFVFGGDEPLAYAPFWMWNGTWTELPTGPTARRLPGLAFDAVRDEVVMFGGNNGFNFDELWIFGTGGWRQVTTRVPPARYAPAMIYDPKRDRTVLFGGAIDLFTHVGDTWEWNGATWTQVITTGGPSARANAAMAYDPIRERVVMFGGSNDLNGGLSDLWEWDGATWIELVAASRPPPRYGATLAWDASRKHLIVFGGSEDNGVVNDTWEWDGFAWNLVAVGNPLLPHQSHVVVSDLDGAGILSFGGHAGSRGSEVPDPGLYRLRWDSTAIEETCARDDVDGDGLAGCADPDCWTKCAPSCPPGATCAGTGPRCGDGFCDPVRESCLRCPGDCGTCLPSCGDLACDATESVATCPGDCTP